MSDDDNLDNDKRPKCPPDENVPEDDYKIGYCRPPLWGRFKKGDRGNGKGGKRTRAKTIEAALEAKMAEVINVRINGKIKKLTMAEAIVQAAAHRAVTSEKGNIAFLNAVRLMKPRTHNGGKEIDPSLSPEETQKIIDDFVERATIGWGLPKRTTDEAGDEK